MIMANLEHMTLSYLLLKQAKVEERPFTLHCWELPSGSWEYDYPIEIHGNKSHPCGYAACLGGLMMNDPAHNDLGFIAGPGKNNRRQPVYKDQKGALAIATFWDIDPEIVHDICYVGRYETKDPTFDDVLQRLSRHIDLQAERSTTSCQSGNNDISTRAPTQKD
jgi:hypothetical protein